MNRFRRYLAGSVLAIFLVVPAVLRADCPDGIRTPTEAERKEYSKTVNALKAAVPPAPSDWQLQLPKSYAETPPTYACKGLKLTPGPYDVTYTSVEQQQLNARDSIASDTRIAAMRKLSPEEQKQADDFTRQGMQLSGQSAAARKNNNVTEATRLREAAMQAYAKSRAVYEAHRDKVEPQIAAILAADRAKAAANPEVRVCLAVDDLRVAVASGDPKIEIPGVPQAFFDNGKGLNMLFGRDAAGRNIRVRLEGDRERVLTIARLFAESSLRTLAAK